MGNEVKALLDVNLYEDIKHVAESGVNLSPLKNKTVVITGAGGLLGFYLTCALLIINDLYSAGIRVIAVDNSDSIFKQYGKLTYREDIEFNVTSDYSGLIPIKADFIIHTKRTTSNTEIINLLEFIKANGARSVICSHSDIYGDVFNGRDTISENDMGFIDSYKPENNTVQLERSLESSAVICAEEYKLDIKLARICQVYGAIRQEGNNTFLDIFSNVIDKKNINIDKNDAVLESYIYVTDAAAALIKILTDGKRAEVYNVASGYAASTHVIAKYCAKLFSELGIKIVYKNKPLTLSPMAPTLKVLDISKLKALGFTPEVELPDGIIKSTKILFDLKKRGE